MGDEPAPLDERHLTEIEERIRASEFHRWAGMKLVSLGEGRAVVALELKPHHLNPQGLVHGGMISTLADTAAGLAVRSGLRAGLTHRTAQMNVHFLGKAETGTIIAYGRAVHVGNRMGYGEADLVDQDGRSIARATATFIVLPAPGTF